MSRTAIIAVHGVADQKPGETARSVAALLHQYPQAGVAYEPFVEEQLSLPVRKMCIDQPRVKVTKWKMLAPFFERGSYLNTNPARSVDPGKASLEFMADQVSTYDPEDTETVGRDNLTYHSIRLRSQCNRSGGTGQPVETTDVYEMFWADQSRLGSGVFQVLISFYQLVFHVCSLGRDTLDFALVEFPKSKRMWGARIAHAVVNFCLTLLAPILNLGLLLVLLLVAPAKVPVNLQMKVAIASSLAIGLASIVASLILRDGRGRPRRLPSLIGLSGCLVSAGLLTSCLMFPSFVVRILACEWLVVAAVGFTLIVDRYAWSKPQARLVGGVLGSLIFGLVTYELASHTSSYEGVASAAIRCALVIFLGLELTWIVIGVGLVFAFVVTAAGLRFQSSGSATRLQRSLGTAFVSLILPATLFIVVTVLLYTPLLYVSTPGKYGILVLPEVGVSMPWVHQCMSVISKEAAKSFPTALHETPRWLFLVTVTQAFPQILAIWGVAGSVAVWSFLRSVIVESSRPPVSDSDRSDHVGRKLTAGFGRLGWVFGFLFIAFPLVFAIGSFWKRDMNTGAWSMIITSMGAVTVFVIVTGKLDDIIAKVWPPLDIILDVDNYLRTRPTTKNPKSQIFTRYVSLLRFVASQGYDKVLFVCHSQGTVITSDLLRFLRQHPDPELAALGWNHKYSLQKQEHDFSNLYLITMGCPLRQLYGWRFPHLYEWARHEGHRKEDDANPANAANGNRIGQACRPDPADLGVQRWINAYCSGDYVGRHIWRDDNLGDPDYNAQTLYTPWGGNSAHESRDSEQGDYRRRELCFGVGAHTHYFEDCASDIAVLISEVLKSPSDSPNAPTLQSDRDHRQHCHPDHSQEVPEPGAD